MTIIQNNIEVQKSVAEVYAFLSDLNNHEQLMPENITNWSSSYDHASFTIKNMAKLSLKMSQRIENKELVCVPEGDTPFALTLRWKIDQQGASTTIASFVIEAELNMMMKMMASGPLQKLVDHQVNKLKEILG
ncbi:SRPBCC family protein [Sphingobacterium shayense]|uniref:SRPBCC family protein n=1 Tax=Sphingobacterium shayense TaxID=626343 RepID=UPI0015573D5F|nr:SRPBCC family protein [Sphingobacterium shayense]NQD70591.1 SRPBCC family protein [Sphingobacterium shayense]